MNVIDTIVWLVNFPATHAYEMIFVGAFASFGLIRLAFARGPRRSRLEELRIERGMASPEIGAGRRIAASLKAWFFRILSLVVMSGLLIAIVSVIFGPITRGYIYEHGVQAIGRDDSDAIVFTTEDGQTQRVVMPFFSPATYPDRDAFVSMADTVVVRYLPSHPQAYVVDTRETLDPWGEPIGD